MLNRLPVLLDLRVVLFGNNLKQEDSKQLLGYIENLYARNPFLIWKNKWI